MREDLSKLMAGLAETTKGLINKSVDAVRVDLTDRVSQLEKQTAEQIADVSKQSMTVETTALICKTAIEKFAESLPRPELTEEEKKGIADAVFERIELPEPEKGSKGDKGDPGADGEDGKSVDVADVELMVEQAVIRAFEGIELPAGKDGRDALELEVLPEIDEGKSYPRGTYARHNGGVYRAWQQTQGMSGWEPLLDGNPTVHFGFDGRRTFSICVDQPSGEQEREFYKLPIMIYQGVWKSGKYDVGDTVTMRGSLYHNDEPENEKTPGTKDCGWTLCVKKGRDA